MNSPFWSCAPQIVFSGCDRDVSLHLASIFQEYGVVNKCRDSTRRYICQNICLEMFPFLCQLYKAKDFSLSSLREWDFFLKMYAVNMKENQYNSKQWHHLKFFPEAARKQEEEKKKWGKNSGSYCLQTFGKRALRGL